MSGNFLRTYEAELQDTVPGIRRKIGIQALLNAMRSRTQARNRALQAPQVPVVDLDGDIYPRPVAGSLAWDNAMYMLFRPVLGVGTWNLPTDGWALRFPIQPLVRGNPTNYWVSMVAARLAMQFRMAIRRARQRIQQRRDVHYSSGNPLVDLF